MTADIAAEYLNDYWLDGLNRHGITDNASKLGQRGNMLKGVKGKRENNPEKNGAPTLVCFVFSFLFSYNLVVYCMLFTLV